MPPLLLARPSLYRTNTRENIITLTALGNQ